MAASGNKIRAYELARELRLDNKKVIEEARRQGIEITVPSETMPIEVADRIRKKYIRLKPRRRK